MSFFRESTVSKLTASDVRVVPKYVKGKSLNRPEEPSSVMGTGVSPSDTPNGKMFPEEEMAHSL